CAQCTGLVQAWVVRVFNAARRRLRRSRTPARPPARVRSAPHPRRFPMSTRDRSSRRPNRLATIAAALALSMAAPMGFAGTAPADAPARSGPTQARADLVDTAVAAGDFKTLVAAIQAAGLVDTLKGAGPFTVFAPTDAAF